MVSIINDFSDFSNVNSLSKSNILSESNIIFPQLSEVKIGPSWNFHKFGGSSLKNTDSYSFVASLINQFDGMNLIVVSAMSGITNQLYDLCNISKLENCSKNANWENLVDQVSSVIISQLGFSSFYFTEMDQFNNDLVDIKRFLSSMKLSSIEEQNSIEQLIVGYGEIWSARLLSYIFKNNYDRSCKFLDASKVLCIKTTNNDIDICWDLTQKRLDNWFYINPDIDLVIVTGFIAFNIETGCSTTLKRNGSDFTATIFSVLTRANSVTIWKDVDGIYTSNPHLNPDAKLITEISYEETENASNLGDFVLQFDCIKPAKLYDVPIFLRNCFKLDCPGTRIGKTKNIGSFSNIFEIKKKSENENINEFNICIQ